MTKDAERVQVESRSEWRGWLSRNHSRLTGIWLVTYKKAVPEKYVSYDDIVEEALCFGWVDSLPRRLDEERSMLWMAPRKPGSGWSRLNKQRVEKMIRVGLMTPAGLAVVEAARLDGSWSDLDSVENLEIPPDLGEALNGYPDAGENFANFPRSVKRGILEWIHSAKKPETRRKRIEETARLAQENIRANQWRK